MLYFAYGSNLSIARLQQRIPSRLVTTGLLRHYRLVFHKIGRDSSAKCDAFYTGRREDYILGAVYRINPSHKPLLDEVEGLGNGYEIKDIKVITDSGAGITAFLYLATDIDQSRKPFHWYKEHVLRGMREHGFPAQYLSSIAALESIADHDPTRTEKEMRIYSQKSDRDIV